MILGTGIDLIEIRRVSAALDRFGNRFSERILTASELSVATHRNDFPVYLASRFAAKEAVSKSLGTGISGEVGWHSIEVIRSSTGRPEVILHGGAKELVKNLGGQRVLLSLSHTRDHAIAVALVEG